MPFEQVCFEGRGGVVCGGCGRKFLSFANYTGEEARLARWLLGIRDQQLSGVAFAVD